MFDVKSREDDCCAGYPLLAFDLPGEDLRYEEWREANAHRGLFTDADLTGSLASDSDFSCARFNGANLTNVTFINCDFTNAVFTGITFDERTVFINCTFSGNAPAGVTVKNTASAFS